MRMHGCDFSAAAKWRRATPFGSTAATAAAEAVGGIVVAPDFGPAREEGWKDFNDL